tara:strand:- start:53 stop:457 length:405 start_codon:yes stop_codon:yes gene_type:complete
VAEERLRKQIREFIEKLESRPPESTQERFPGRDWSDAMIYRRNREPYLRDLGQLKMRQTPVLEEEAKGKDFFKRWIEWKRQMAQEVLPFMPMPPVLKGLKALSKVIPNLKQQRALEQRFIDSGGGPIHPRHYPK